MSIKEINQEVIFKLSNGEEKAFSLLYDCYYTYLNSVALFYIFDRDIANEVVNNVFLNIWQKRTDLVYPIHSYLVQSVKNGCLNNIRAQKTNERVLNNHCLQMLEFQEEYINSNPTPLQYVETQEVEKQVRDAIEKLPEKCKVIFKHYIFSAMSPEDIATELMISVSTVRVQIKNALDKLKVSLNHSHFIINLFTFKMMDKFDNKIFENLVTDYFSGSISEEDMQQMIALFNSNNEFQSRFNELNKLHAISFTPAIEENKSDNYKKLIQQLDITEAQPEKIRHENIIMRPSWLKKIANIAAIILFAFTVSISTFYLTRNIILDKYNNAYSETIVPMGSQTKLVLPDGTIVWLNSGTKLKYNKNFGEKLREVILSGEGYFEVKKDAAKPFIVHTNSLDVNVTGTVFNVASYEEDSSVEVNLIQGSVNVTLQDSQNQNAVKLEPNERLIYNKQSQQISTSLNDASKSALWKTGKLSFENETLEDIVNKLERKYNVKIVIDNQQIKKETFSGSIDLNNSLKDVFSYIDVDNKFIYKQVGDTFRIK